MTAAAAAAVDETSDGMKLLSRCTMKMTLMVMAIMMLMLMMLLVMR